jgi:phage tail-like protein
VTAAGQAHRGSVADLAPRPALRAWLPAVYAEDEFLQELLAGLDSVLAPVISTLDNLSSYLDADLTPADFLPWLASWVGLRVDERWAIERRRAVVGQGGRAWRGRATIRALQEILALALGPDVDVQDNGGVAFSINPRGPLPGDAEPALRVRIPAGADQEAVRAWVATIVDEFRPVHVRAVIESGAEGEP